MPVLTNHCKRRAKQRAGVTKNTLTTIASRAFQEGIRHSEAIGSLRNWMNSEYLKYKSANNCRLYANKLYIFHNDILITIINAPLCFERDLYHYVKSLKIYLRYKRNRLKRKKNYGELSKHLLEEVYNDVYTDVQSYINSICKDKKYIFETIYPYSFCVIIDYNNKKLDDELASKIKKHIHKKFGLDTQFKRVKNKDTEVEEIKQE